MKKMQGTIGKFIRKGSVLALVLICFMCMAVPALAASRTEPIEEITIAETSSSTWSKPDFTVTAVGMKVYEKTETYDREQDKYDWVIKVGAKNGYRFDNQTTYLYVESGDLYAHFKRESDTEATIRVSTSPLVIDVYPKSNQGSNNSSGLVLPEVTPKPILKPTPKPSNEPGFIITDKFCWQKVNGNWYYTNGIEKKTGWQLLDKKWYYFSYNGVMQTGWQYIGEKYYYFNTDGVMQTGWLTLDGKKFYLDSDGIMQTGWQLLDNKWYYFSDQGYMTLGWQYLGERWFYMGDDGIMRTGWQKIGDYWYYFTEKAVTVKTHIYDVFGGDKAAEEYMPEGSMFHNTWVYYQNHYRYFKSDGKMAVNEWVANYHFNQNGDLDNN